MGESSPRMRLALLGRFQADVDGEPLSSFRTKKTQALLIFLTMEDAFQRGRPTRRETLLGVLWPDYPEQSARQNLRTTLSYLRRALEVLGEDETGEAIPFLLSDNQSIRINPAVAYVLDAAQFINLVDECTAHNHDDLAECPACLQRLKRAVALNRGEFLSDFYLTDSAPFEEWAAARRANLKRQLLNALETLTAAALQSKELETAELYARQQLALDNLREVAHRQLMELLVRQGKRTEALSQYEQCRTLLAQELRTEPSPKTKMLYERIRSAELGTAVMRSDRIKGYRLLEEIGAGSFGVVHRASQTAVDRQVAIKIVRSEYANHPDFIRRFEVEAQLVARLEHPHIVPLYDYWREPEGAYLVMRWLRGGSLQASLEQGAWEPTAAAGLVDQIAGALASAHRQGVVHRDIKPANVLLDEEGNAYLSDFGIAKDLVKDHRLTEIGEMLGSPAYISPEQALNEQVTPLTDIYSLGVVLYELLTGEHPFPSIPMAALISKHLLEPLPSLLERFPELPPALDAVIKRATAKNAEERYPDALALAAAFGQAARSQPFGEGLVSEITLVNPYKGLRPFQESDAADFFGREALTEELLGRLGSRSQASATGVARKRLASVSTDGRFLAVVGPSGSGKSSLVKAGVLPALRRGEVDGSQDWFIVEMMPGSHPMEELEAGLLRIAVNPPATLIEQLVTDKRGVVRAVKRVLPGNGEAELLLVVDQFEELFTLVTTREERELFLDSLHEAATDPRSRVRIIVTLRADFYDRPLLYPDFGEFMGQHTRAVVPLSADELGRAICDPAERAGAEVEPELLAAIVSDVGQQPGALPLLQYALTELFERREGRRMTLAAYDEMGGVLGALGRRAEEIYRGLNEAQQEATRQLFLRLVTLGEGVEDTRRRVLRSELDLLTTPGNGRRPEVEKMPSPGTETLHATTLQEGGTTIDQGRMTMGAVIDTFGRYRLLTFDRDPSTRGPTVEVAHEALLREWKRLREWLEESRHEIRMQRIVAQAAGEWASAGQDARYLLRGGRLDQLGGWAAESDIALTQAERMFLDKSLEGRRQRQAEEESRRQRELETARQLAETERKRAEEQSRSAGRLRRSARYLVGALVVAAVLALVAYFAFRQASDNAETAEANSQLAATREMDAVMEAEQRATAQAAAEIEAEQRATAEALALAESEQRATAEAEAISERVRADEERDLAVTAQAVAQGAAIMQATAEAVAVQERQEALRQASIGLGSQALLELESSFPERAPLLALEALEEYPYTWQAENALGQAVIGSRLRHLFQHDNLVNTITWSPDGGQIATASDDGTAKVWDARTGELVFTLEDEPWINQALWSPSGDRILTNGGSLKVWDTTSGKLLFTKQGHDPWTVYADWSPDGDRIFTTGWDDWTAKMWDAATGDELFTLVGHGEGKVRTCGNANRCTSGYSAWSPAGDRIVTRGEDGYVIVWDAASGDEMLRLETRQDYINSAAWSPDGERILTSSDDGQALVWDLKTGNVLAADGLLSELNGALWSPNGDRFVTFGLEGTARIWDAATGQELLALGDRSYVTAAWSYDGARLLAGGNNGELALFDTGSGGILQTFRGHQGPAYQVEWAPSGEQFASAGSGGRAVVWSLKGAMKPLEIASSGESWASSQWSPDGLRIARPYLDGRVELIDSESGQVGLDFQTGHEGYFGVTWSPSGRRLLSAGVDGIASIWDTEGGDLLLTIVDHPGRLCGLGAWSPDGQRVATGGLDDSTVRIWDVASGEQILLFNEHVEVDKMICPYWSPDGRLFVSTSWSGRAIIWDPDSGEILHDLYPPGFIHNLLCISWSPDSSRLLIGSSEGKLRVWDVHGGEELLALENQTWAGCGWFPSGERFLAGDQDSPLKIWDATSGAELLSAHLPMIPGGWISLAPDGSRYLYPHASDTSLRIADIWQSTEELLQIAHECCVIGELTVEERLFFGLPER